MPRRRKPPIDRDVAAQMQEAVATGVATFLDELTSSIFDDHRCVQSQDTILRGIAEAVRKYEKTTGVPIARTLAYDLLDTAP